MIQWRYSRCVQGRRRLAVQVGVVFGDLRAVVMIVWNAEEPLVGANDLASWEVRVPMENTRGNEVIWIETQRVCIRAKQAHVFVFLA